MEQDGYCMKCKCKRVIRNGQRVTLKNGRQALKGTCSICGTNITRFLPKDN